MYSVPYHTDFLTEVARVFGTHSTWVWVGIAFAFLILAVVFGIIMFDTGNGGCCVAACICIASAFITAIPAGGSTMVPDSSSRAARVLTINHKAGKVYKDGMDSKVSRAGADYLHLSFDGGRIFVDPVGRGGKAYLAVAKYINNNGYVDDVSFAIASRQGTRCRVNTVNGEKTVVAYSNGRKTPVKSSKRTIVLSPEK